MEGGGARLNAQCKANAGTMPNSKVCRWVDCVRELVEGEQEIGLEQFDSDYAGALYQGAAALYLVVECIFWRRISVTILY